MLAYPHCISKKSDGWVVELLVRNYIWTDNYGATKLSVKEAVP